MIRLFCCLLLLSACAQNPPSEQPPPKDYLKIIKGVNEPIPADSIQKGEVLIAYSDCYTCHSREKREKGPSFKDIATRYPANKAYIRLLAEKIIQGGSGAWGHPVMEPHPHLSVSEAQLMASYILSLKNGK